MRTKAEIADAFSPRSALDDRKSFFLVGIGGAGMSGIARMLHHRGFTVRGTDSTDSPLIQQMMAEGMDIKIGHSGESLQAEDALVLSDAIDLNASAEVDAARKLGNIIVRRSQVLGWLLKGKRVIAVTGTHGKTTTTGMLAHAIRNAGGDPTVVVGAEVPQLGGAVVEGSDDWAVIEACEAYDSFHDFDPEIIVLTNLELDHVDFHRTWENLRDSVVQFVNKLPANGTLIYNPSDPGSKEVAELVTAPTLPMIGGISEYPKMRLPGSHNFLNAVMALTAGERAGFDSSAVMHGTADFAGAERRLQVIEEDLDGIAIVDDYAHHPTEISATLKALRYKFPGRRRLVVVYQPHLYSRTAPLIPEFAAALSQADLVVLTDIYPAREAPIPGVSSFRIAEALTVPGLYVPSRHLLPREVLAIARPGDIVVGMGAGNISEFPPAFRDELRRRQSPPKRVVVAFGGDSAEREVSIHSGRSVSAALKKRGYEVRLVDFSDRLLSGQALEELTGLNRPDVVFLAVHGSRAEDGAIQGLLELLHLPYTGSGVLASAIAMDKDRTKTLLQAAGLPVPKGVCLAPGDPLPDIVPAVVKPNAQGSTVGLSFVETEEQLAPAVARAFEYDDRVLVEEWVKGVEISVPVLGDRALPVVEIVPEAGNYDFANKYTPGATNEICPARLTEAQTELAKSYALHAHQTMGCRGASRTDMIVAGDRIVILEINTLPGMTATSLVPRSAETAGMSFEDLVEWMVKDALAATLSSD